MTLGESIIRLLENYGIDTVFGIPGVHTVELYRGLGTSPIRHVSARHEQALGFMADGYHRATGKIAAAFVITGPGLTNIATAMAQAYADSIPMLVVSSVNRRGALGMEAGDLHELRRQGSVAQQLAAFSHTVMTADELPHIMARAFAVFEGARPRPVHIEIPVDLLSASATENSLARVPKLSRPSPALKTLKDAADLLANAKKPVILAGGGAKQAADPLTALATRIDAPVIMTINGRGILPGDHPLAIPGSPSMSASRALIEASDAVLSVGTEFGQTDYFMRGYSKPPQLTGKHIRIEIDPEQMHRGLQADLPLISDAVEGVSGLLELLPPNTRTGDGAARAQKTRQEILTDLDAANHGWLDLLAEIQRQVPTAPIVGDSTKAIYAGNFWYPAQLPGTWFNAASGYGALGYGLPAAIGAAIATDDRVICISGDGGLQFTLGELGTAMEENTKLTLIIVNNSGYGEIKDYMKNFDITATGVDLYTPDFVSICRAYGFEAAETSSIEGLVEIMKDQLKSNKPGAVVLNR